MLGERAAMAATVAIEEVISEHYNDQVRTMYQHEKKDRQDRDADETQMQCTRRSRPSSSNRSMRQAGEPRPHRRACWLWSCRLLSCHPFVLVSSNLSRASALDSDSNSASVSAGVFSASSSPSPSSTGAAAAAAGAASQSASASACDSLSSLASLIAKHRDEEDEHRHIGLQHEATLTPFYTLYTQAIKLGCRAAIAITQKL